MYRSKKVALIAYNFPHLKTQSFLLRMMIEGIIPDVILAADPVTLNVPPSSIKTKIRHQAVINTIDLAHFFKIPFYVVKHNSDFCKGILNEMHIDVAVISGARILKKKVIEAIPNGIINFHPGLIPEARGLDAMLWSIYNDVPLGITSHIIDEDIDAGKILEINKINIYKQDTIFDLSERLVEEQTNMLVSAFDLAIEEKYLPIPLVNTNYNKKMPDELEIITLNKLNKYILNFATK